MNILNEIREQPNAFRQLLKHYLGEGELARVPPISKSIPLFITGMGASYHVAWNTALYINSLGFNAKAIEASDLVYYSGALLKNECILIYISQSGESAEVSPILRQLGEKCFLVAITNNLESPLANFARISIPMLAGTEKTIASKTFVNSIALLWLLARHWFDAIDGTELQQIDDIAKTLDELIVTGTAIQEQLIARLGTGANLSFLGHGPHAVTAQQSAMMLAEVAGVSTWSASIGTYRHGFIEKVHGETKVVLFFSDGPGAQSSKTLAAELTGYGAQVTIIQRGTIYQIGEPYNNLCLSEFLAPIANTIPIQFYALALAEIHGHSGEFRYISKVIHQL